jgi:hypothetical protein
VEMKDILFRLLLAAAVTLAALTLWSPAHGQQVGEDATPTNSRPRGKNLQSSSRSENPLPSANVSPLKQTQDEMGF